MADSPRDKSPQAAYVRLRRWVEDSLDLFKNDLLPLLYPVFVHTYLDLVAQDDLVGAKSFFTAHASSFPEHSEELRALESINGPQHLHENSLAIGFRNSKYFLVMGRYAYDLLINFLEENNIIHVLKIMNQYMEIKAQTGPRTDDQPSGIGAHVSNCPLDLNTALVSYECEEAVLAAEQYRYDHLETYVLQLKKQRESRRVEARVRPSPSQICAEIEKLKDLCKRVSLNKNFLPSICCYTVYNTYEKMTCAEISDDATLLACGYSDSYIDVHSLTNEPLRVLKSSSELSRIDIRGPDEKFDSVGSVKRLVEHSGPIYALRFAASSKMLLSASQDCTVRLWSLDLFKTVAVYKAHSFPVWTVDFAPNGFFFASGGADKQAVLWSTRSLRPERLFVSALSDVTVVKFHPNSNYLFTGSSDHKIRMHDIDEATVVRVFCGHTSTVTCIDVSHCGRLMVSGSRDKSVILWDVESAKPLARFLGHEGPVYSVSFSYFGSVICSSGADSSVRLWDKGDSSGTCLGTYYTRGTPVFQARFAYRNIISCVGPFLGQSM